MSERKMLEGHLGASDVRVAYRGERDAVRRSHLQVIWLLLEGMSRGEVSRVTGFTQRWILKLIERWNAGGYRGAGRPSPRQCRGQPLMDAAGLAALAAALEGAPADSGLWSGRQVAAWM